MDKLNNFNIIEETYSSDEDTSPQERELGEEFHRGTVTWCYEKYHTNPSNYKAGREPRYPGVVEVNYRDRSLFRDYVKENSRAIQEEQVWIQSQEPIYYKLRLQRLQNLRTIVTKKCNRDCIREWNRWLRKHPGASIKDQVKAFEKLDLVRRQVIHFCTDNPNHWIEGTYSDYNDPSNIHLEVCWYTARKKSIYKTIKQAKRVFLSRLISL